MAKYIKFKTPSSCSRCPCLRNTEFGLKCFLTDEDLTHHDINISYEIGSYCPSKEENEEIKRCLGCESLVLDKERFVCTASGNDVYVDVRMERDPNCPKTV